MKYSCTPTVYSQPLFPPREPAALGRLLIPFGKTVVVLFGLQIFVFVYYPDC